eukprot:contig_42263_g9571
MGTPMPKVKIPTPAAGSLRLLAASAAGVGSLYTMYKYGLYNVDGGHRAVVYNRITGVKEEVYGEGHPHPPPLCGVPVIYDVRASPAT